MEKRCAACGQAFEPNPRIHQQAYCPNPECQRERRRRWQQQKRRDDADYRDNDVRASKAWASENPEYWKHYRDENPTYAERNRTLQQQRNRNLRASVIANEDVSRPFNQLPAGRYRMVRIKDGIAKGDAWIVEITVLATIPVVEDV